MSAQQNYQTMGDVPTVMAVAVPDEPIKQDIESSQPQTKVRVIAPSNLPTGYRLHVQVNGQPTVVIVVSNNLKDSVESKESV